MGKPRNMDSSPAGTRSACHRVLYTAELRDKILKSLDKNDISNLGLVDQSFFLSTVKIFYKRVDFHKMEFVLDRTSSEIREKLYKEAVEILDFDILYIRVTNLWKDGENFTIHFHFIKVETYWETLTRQITATDHEEFIYEWNHTEEYINTDTGYPRWDIPDHFISIPIIDFHMHIDSLEWLSEKERLRVLKLCLVERLNVLNGRLKNFYVSKYYSNTDILKVLQLITEHGHRLPTHFHLPHWDDGITDLLLYCGSSLTHLYMADCPPSTLAEILCKLPWDHFPNMQYISLKCQQRICEYGSTESEEDLASLDGFLPIPGVLPKNLISLSITLLQEDFDKLEIQHKYEMLSKFGLKIGHMLDLEHTFDHVWETFHSERSLRSFRSNEEWDEDGRSVMNFLNNRFVEVCRAAATGDRIFPDFGFDNAYDLYFQDWEEDSF